MDLIDDDNLSECSNTSMSGENREIKKLVKNLMVSQKENRKLQSDITKLQKDLQSKNETINSILDQNYSELRKLQSTHKEITDQLIKDQKEKFELMESNQKIFMKSVRKKIKETINANCMADNSKFETLRTTISDLQSELSQSKKSYDEVSDALGDLKKETENGSLDRVKNEQLEAENIILRDEIEKTRNRYQMLVDEFDRIQTQFQETDVEKKKLETELIQFKTDTLNDKLVREKLAKELESLKTTHQSFLDKYNMIVRELSNKQATIDEKMLEIFNLNNKVEELEKLNKSVEENRIQLNSRMVEHIDRIDTLEQELHSLKRQLEKVKTEKGIVLEEKLFYIQEMESYKSKLKNTEEKIVMKIKDMQDILTKDKEKLQSDLNRKEKELEEKCDRTISSLKSEYESKTLDKDKQIDALVSHVKSLTDTQYIALSREDKIKGELDKLKGSSSEIEKRILEVQLQSKREIEALKLDHQKQLNDLMGVHEDSVKSATSGTEELQTKLNKAMEGLSMSREKIKTLMEEKESNLLELKKRDDEVSGIKERLNRFREENIGLLDKLNRLSELNDTLNNKEKNYEIQIKKLQHQIVNLSKK